MYQQVFEISKEFNEEDHTMKISSEQAMKVLRKETESNAISVGQEITIKSREYWYSNYELKLANIAGQYIIKCQQISKYDWHRAFGFNVHAY